MDAETFVRAIRAGVLEVNLAHYSRLLQMPLSQVSDEQLRSIIEAFARMDPAQQAATRLLMRNVMADTISHLLGILDGLTTVEGVDEELSLTYGDSPEPLNGRLNESFWIEEHTREDARLV